MNDENKTGRMDDIPAGEEERVDHEAVRGKDQIAQDGPVGQSVERRVRERGEDAAFDQAGGLFPAAAVVKGNDVVHMKRPFQVNR